MFVCRSGILKITEDCVRGVYWKLPQGFLKSRNQFEPPYWSPIGIAAESKRYPTIRPGVPIVLLSDFSMVCL